MLKIRVIMMAEMSAIFKHCPSDLYIICVEINNIDKKVIKKSDRAFPLFDLGTSNDIFSSPYLNRPTRLTMIPIIAMI